MTARHTLPNTASEAKRVPKAPARASSHLTSNGEENVSALDVSVECVVVVEVLESEEDLVRVPRGKHRREPSE